MHLLSYIKLAKWQEKIRNMRNDSLHKLTYQIANAYDTVIVEDE